MLSGKTCIMTAYADETRALLSALGQEAGDSVNWNGRHQFEGCDGDWDWVVLQSGMGKVRAASMCQLIIDQYQVETFFEFGFAGGIVDSLVIGDLLAINGVSEHDVPNRPEIQAEQNSWRDRLFRLSSLTITEFASLLSSQSGFAVREAAVVCGDMDLYDRPLRDKIALDSGAVAATWESAAIVDVCAINDVKYVGTRVISDLCVVEDQGPISQDTMSILGKSTRLFVEALRGLNGAESS
jgi:adenosylhomocysteine nucleosidase